jgi:hypothetical protein
MAYVTERCTALRITVNCLGPLVQSSTGLCVAECPQWNDYGGRRWAGSGGGIRVPRRYGGGAPLAPQSIEPRLRTGSGMMKSADEIHLAIADPALRRGTMLCDAAARWPRVRRGCSVPYIKKEAVGEIRSLHYLWSQRKVTLKSYRSNTALVQLTYH